MWKISKLSKIKPENAFLILGLIYGICFLFATPALQVPDEYEHFYRALYVSEGHMLPEKVGNMSGVYIPESVQFTASTIFQEWFDFTKDRDNKINLTSLLNIRFTSQNRVFEDISRIAVITYSPVPYIPSAFAITIGKIFNLPPIVLIFLGRLANLLSWVFLTYLAIRIIPVHKWVLLMIGLIPMTLFEVASLSADSLILGLSFIIVAIFFKFAFDDNKKRINKKDVYILFILLLLLSLSKQIYFVLLFLIFLIPNEKFGGRKNMFLITGFLFVSIILVSGGWNLLVKDLYVPIVPQISISSQIAYILGDPLRFPYALLKTFYYRGFSYQLLFVGNFLLDIPLPMWWIGFYVLSIIPVALMDKSMVSINRIQKVISLLIFIIVFLLVCAFVYVSWTVVGQNIIDGIQGRYFIPILPLIFLLLFKIREFDVFKNKLFLSFKNNLNTIIIIYTAIYLFISVIIFITTYYI
ncbi:MAG: DUF2142 domain-containing protein [Methanobacterium sp.]